MELVEALQQVPILSGLPVDDLKLVARNARVQTLPKNTLIINQGGESSLLLLMVFKDAHWMDPTSMDTHKPGARSPRV